MNWNQERHLLSNLLVAQGVQLGRAGGHDLVGGRDVVVAGTIIKRELRDGLVDGGGRGVVLLSCDLGLQGLAVEVHGLGIALDGGVLAGVGVGSSIGHGDVGVPRAQNVGGRGVSSGGGHGRFPFPCGGLFFASNSREEVVLALIVVA